jgi:uncharacterized membrane protein YhhN
MAVKYIYFLIIFAVLLTLREFFCYRKILFLKYILTPLITLTSITVAIFSLYYTDITLYKITIVIALTFALTGDVLLMIEEIDLFIHGLLFFLITQMLYIFVLVPDYHFEIWNIVPAGILFLSVIYLYLHIKAEIKKHNFPLLFYMFVIGAMVYFAIGRLNNGLSVNTLLFSTGALLFVISDVLLAINKFIKKIPNSTVYVWLFYAPAQLLIGLSCYYA